MKKVISLFLSIAMLLSIVSVVDFSAYASVKTGKCGDNLKYSLDRETGTLTISGTGDMYDYLGTGGSFSNSGSPFYRESVLKRIYIENGVTSIGSTMFEYCVNLTFFEIPNSVTSIGDYAFYGCTSLKSVTIPNGVNSIGTYAFEDCTSLTSVTIGNSVTSIGGSAFEDCTSLKSVTIPDSVTSIGSSAFSGCTSLTSVTIRNSVTSIGDYAFYFCDSLTSVTIGNSVTSIGDYAFYNCVRLTSVTIGNSVTSIGKSAFGGCTRLTSVIIGNSVTNIGDYAFYNCTSLESVNYSGTKSQWIAITIGSDNSYLTHAFIKCTDGIIGNGNTVTVDSVKYKLNDDYTAQVISYSGKPKNITISECVSYESYTFKVTGIGDKAFYKCTSLTSVTIPDSVASIGYSAFEDCKSLTSVNYSGTKSQWKSIIFGSYNDELENAIIKCTDGVIGNGNTVTIDNLEYKINNDYTASLVDYKGILKNITISKSVTYEGYTFNVTGIDGAFNGCTSLTSVTIPDSVTNIGNYAFNGCTSLTSVTIPNSVTSIGDSAFSSCTSLTSVTIPYNVTSIGNSAFEYCTSLTSVTIPNNVTNIGYRSFYDCKSLTSITIGNSVTSIGNSAFEYCTSLTSVTIPNSVTSIGDYTFSDCSNLKSVNYNGTKAQWKSISGYSNVSQIIKCTDGIYANSNTIIVDSVNYKLNDDYTAKVISYSGTPENITILESVTYEGLTFKVTSIGSSAFNGCSKLKKIELPDSVTYIGSKAFDGTAFYNTVKNWKDGVLYCGNHLICTKSDVTKITVKASTVSIAAGALDNCKSLEKINVLNPKCVINCTIPKTAVIGGAEGSTAEDFAQKNNMSIDYFEECTHSDKVQVVIAATCTEQGAVQSRCADCDKLISQTFTAPLGHTMVITTPAKAPTCTTSGNTQAGYCTVCGYNEVSTVIPATGHNFGNNSANCLACGVVNPNYVAPTQPTPSPTPSTTPTQPNQNDEDVTVISKPKSASIKKVKGAKKAISVIWKKVGGVKGYQIQVATDKKFKKNKKTVTIKKQKTTKTTVKKLKAKKKYYVRVRAYKTVNGKKVYSSWSKVKTVKTK